MRAWWIALPRRERVLLGLAALALLLGLFTRPLARLVSTEARLLATCPLDRVDLASGLDLDASPLVAVTRGVLEDSLLDPWARPWRYEVGVEDGPRYPPFRLYSVGPDGIDDAGGGDDVVLRPDRWRGLLDQVRPAGVLAAVALLWLWASVRAFFAPRAANGLVEAVRAMVLASLPAAVVAFLVFENARQLAPLQDAVDAQRLVVPFPIAVSATLALILWFVALRLRLRRPASGVEPTSPLAWRGPLLILVGVILLLLGTGVAMQREERSFQRRRLLALACLNQPSPLSQLVEGDDLDLVRAFARRASPLVSFVRKRDAEYDGLARVGKDAVPLFVRALEDGGTPSSSSYARLPWQHLRANDPTLDALFAAIAARPDKYRGLALAQSQLVASRAGRSVVAAAWIPVLDDTSTTGSSFNEYELRACDEAVEKLSSLFAEPLPFEAPSWQDMSTETWNAVVARAKAWAQAGASFGPPVPWVVLDVRGLTLVSKRANVDVTWNDGANRASAGAPDADQLVVLSPSSLREACALRVVDEATSRAVEVSISPRAGETTWVTVDMRAATFTTKVYDGPP